MCIFHVLKELHKHVLDAVRRLRRGLSRRGKRGRKRKPGRRPKARAKRRGLTNKEKSAFVFKHRWLIVRRRDKMSDQERADLATMLSYLPELKALRDFVDRLGMLFEEGQSEALAWGRHAALTANRSFLAVPELAAAIGAARGGEVRQDDRLPEEPGVPTGCGRTTTWSGSTASCGTRRRPGTSGGSGGRRCGSWCCSWIGTGGRSERSASRWQEESPAEVRDRSSPKTEAVKRVA